MAGLMTWNMLSSLFGAVTQPPHIIFILADDLGKFKMLFSYYISSLYESDILQTLITFVMHPLSSRLERRWMEQSGYDHSEPRCSSCGWSDSE